MSYSKLSKFEKDKIKFAALAKAMGHPARLSILEILASRDECMCGNIANMLPLAQSTVSQHLKVLKNAGLIKGEIKGPSICYDVDPDAIAECCELYENFSGKMMKRKKPG